eukprot:3812659-Pleurochrysis_carterae.AAC.3
MEQLVRVSLGQLCARVADAIAWMQQPRRQSDMLTRDAASQSFNCASPRRRRATDVRYSSVTRVQLSGFQLL